MLSHCPFPRSPIDPYDLQHYIDMFNQPITLEQFSHKWPSMHKAMVAASISLSNAELLVKLLEVTLSYATIYSKFDEEVIPILSNLSQAAVSSECSIFSIIVYAIQFKYYLLKGNRQRCTFYLNKIQEKPIDVQRKAAECMASTAIPLVAHYPLDKGGIHWAQALYKQAYRTGQVEDMAYIALGLAYNYGNLGNMQQASRLAILAVHHALRVYKPSLLVRSLLIICSYLQQCHNFSLAARCLIYALELADKHHLLDCYGHIYFAQGINRYYMQRYEPAYEKVHLALAAFKDMPLFLARAYQMLGMICNKLGKIAESKHYYVAAIKLYEQQQANADLANCLLKQAEQEYRFADYYNALRHVQRGLEVSRIVAAKPTWSVYKDLDALNRQCAKKIEDLVLPDEPSD